VAIVGTPTGTEARIAAFHFGWWILAGITALGLIPTFALIRARR
jgi:hypothetical protein